VSFLFLLCSLVGRFGVAFLGFGFNLEDTSFHEETIFRPDWVNGTLNMDDPILKALISALGFVAPETGQ